MAVQEQSHDQSSSVKRKAVDTHINYSQRAQRLQSAVLDANEGMVFTAMLMMGVGALKEDSKVMILSSLARLVGRVFSVATGEFVWVYWKLGIDVARMKREKDMKEGSGKREEEKGGVRLRSPMQAAAALAMAYLVGGMMVILAAVFVKPQKLYIGLMVGEVTLALMVLGEMVTKLGRAPLSRSCVRVLVTYGFDAFHFGLMKLYESHWL